MTEKAKVFAEEIVENLPHFLPEGFVKDVEIKEVQKINRNYTALIVHPSGCEAAPSLDLEQLEQMQDNGMAFSEVMQIVADAVMKKPEGIGLEEVKDYEKIKDRLFIRVCGAESNREVLLSAPHHQCGDLAITYHIMIDMNPETGEGGSVLITKEVMEQYGISEEKLHQDAVRNSEKILKPVVELMDTVINRMMFGIESDTPETLEGQLELIKEHQLMTVLTNRQKLFGASAIFYPGLLEKIAERIGGDLVILPSSIHETILVPAEKMEIEELRKMVMEINRCEVKEEDRLSDNVYLYSSKTKEITIA